MNKGPESFQQNPQEQRVPRSDNLTREERREVLLQLQLLKQSKKGVESRMLPIHERIVEFLDLYLETMQLHAVRFLENNGRPPEFAEELVQESWLMVYHFLRDEDVVNRVTDFEEFFQMLRMRVDRQFAEFFARDIGARDLSRDSSIQANAMSLELNRMQGEFAYEVEMTFLLALQRFQEEYSVQLTDDQQQLLQQACALWPFPNERDSVHQILMSLFPNTALNVTLALMKECDRIAKRIVTVLSLEEPLSLERHDALEDVENEMNLEDMAVDQAAVEYFIKMLEDREQDSLGKKIITDFLLDGNLTITEASIQNGGTKQNGSDIFLRMLRRVRANFPYID